MDDQTEAARVLPLTRWDVLRRAVVMWRRRWLPYLVWHGDELDVRVTFKENRLPPLSVSDMRDYQQATQVLHQGTLHECEKHLNDIGIEFDIGLGLDGRDWEWDWSLSGPISVTFQGRAGKPERRQ